MKFLNEILERPADERAYMIIVAGHLGSVLTLPVSKFKEKGTC